MLQVASPNDLSKIWPHEKFIGTAKKLNKDARSIFLTILELWKGIFTTHSYVPMNSYEFLNSLPFFYLYHAYVIYVPYYIAYKPQNIIEKFRFFSQNFYISQGLIGTQGQVVKNLINQTKSRKNNIEIIPMSVPMNFSYRDREFLQGHSRNQHTHCLDPV